MFGLFKKKIKVLGLHLHPELLSFSESLSPKEKAAMAYAFSQLLTIQSTPLNIKMYQYWKSQFESIHFNITSGYMQSFKTAHAEEFIDILKRLSIEQKQWFAIALHDMLFKIDVKPTRLQIAKFIEIGDKIANPFMRLS